MEPRVPNLDDMMDDLLKDLGDYRSDLDDYDDEDLYDDWMNEEEE